MTDFVHLHVHTEYSLLDGACRIKQLCSRLKEIGQNAIAITDHGVMYGVIDFYRACKAEGIKPIIGCEVYLAPHSRFDKDPSPNGQAYHLVLLCENETGYHNLIQMVSQAFIEGFYKKPRIDMDLLRQHHEGLICLSACLAGQIPVLLNQENYDGAKAVAEEFQQLFGRDHFYLEVQDHGIPAQRSVAQELLRLHRETGIPLVATNDAHYIRREDARMQDVLLCIQTGSTLDEENRMRFETQEFYLKSGDEMAQLFQEYPQALENTKRIADLCNVEFEFGKYHLPQFPLPAPYTDSYQYFDDLCRQGFAERYPDADQAKKERLTFEMNMISEMGFVDYFLIVSDFIQYAKRNDIPVGPGRGSAAGSIVSFCLGITDVDPLKYNLYFERFLNPSRVTMPDIDVDFCYNRRPEVIEYVTQKYGEDHVAQIVTFGTMAARAAVRDVGRVLNMPYADVDVVAKLVPATLHMTLDTALEVSPQLKELYDTDPRVKDLLDTARSLEGMPRHASTHAAGVVITGRPVSEYVPLAKNDESIVTQFGMVTLEELGLLKMDFLGLRNLTVIHDAQRLIQRHHPDFSMAHIPDNDPATYAMLSAGKTSGVFQLESAGMTGVCVSMSPQSIEDITAVVALYRPGPMDSIPLFIDRKLHPSHIQYKDPRLKEILEVTYGCTVYQEQVQEILRKLGGFSLGQADVIRRAMSKKKMAEILKYRKTFIFGDSEENIPGAIQNGVSQSVAESIYDEIIDFANYAFNKAHAVCYAIVAYQTAYLKCHYPKEYMAALLTSVLDSSDKVSGYIGECRELGIQVLPPDINESDGTFTVSGDAIRFALVAVKNVGRGMIQDLVRERESGGNFTSFQDFCRRMSEYDFNRRALENLIRCGAFDSFHQTRATLLASCGSILDSIAADRRKNIAGQLGLFGEETTFAEEALPQIPEYSSKELISMEKETLGLYLSGHPMHEYKKEFLAVRAIPIGQILRSFTEEGAGTPASIQDGQKVTVAGILTTFKTKTTKNNSLMAYATLEDESGAMELMIFSSVLKQAGNLLKTDAAIAVVGRVSTREDREPQLMCDAIEPLEHCTGPIQFQKGNSTPRQTVAPSENVLEGKTLWLKLTESDAHLAKKVKAMLTMFPGNNRTVLYYADTKRRETVSCEPRARLVTDLETLLGSPQVVLK